MEYTLNMVFLTTGGKKTTFSITGVRSVTTDVQINTLMNSILAENIFTTASGDLVSKVSASFVEKKVTDIAMA